MLEKQSRNNQYIRPPLQWKEARKVEVYYRPKIIKSLNKQIVKYRLKEIISKGIPFWEKIKKKTVEEEQLNRYIGSLINEYRPTQNDSQQSERLKKLLLALWITTVELGIIYDKARVKRQLLGIGDDRINQAVNQMTYQVKLTNNSVLELLNRQTAKKIVGINNTQRIRIKNVITNGIIRNLSISEIVTELSVLGEINERRAWTITRTEIMQAKAYENQQYLTRRGFDRWKWVCNQPVDICLVNCGVVRKIGEPFPDGHTTPLVHPNCMCETEGSIPTGRQLTTFITLILSGYDWSGG